MQVTKDNFNEIFTKPETKEILLNTIHPIQRMDESGFTYYDYILFTLKKNGKPNSYIIRDLNLILNGKTINYYA